MDSGVNDDNRGIVGKDAFFMYSTSGSPMFGVGDTLDMLVVQNRVWLSVAT